MHGRRKERSFIADIGKKKFSIEAGRSSFACFTRFTGFARFAWHLSVFSTRCHAVSGNRYSIGSGNRNGSVQNPWRTQNHHVGRIGLVITRRSFAG
jgi:hypothetical protein